MKKIIICSLLMCVSSIQAQTSTKNYVKETVRRTSSSVGIIVIGDTNTHFETTTYFDGLGRPIQIVDQNSSPEESKNIVTHVEYEKYIGQVKEYLPFTEKGRTEQAPIKPGGAPTYSYDSNFVDGALNKTLSFYNTPYYDNTTNPYTENRLENSPRKRVVETAFPGDDWSINFNNQSTDYRNTIRNEYSFNVANEVKRYVVSTVFSQGIYKNSISDNGFYASNQLTKSIIKNENWKAGDGNNNTMVEYKDINGKVLLKRTYNDNVPHDTYYVYNNLDLLAFVISPLADGDVSSHVLNELCYQYNYDAKKRLVEKKLPQKEWEYIIYDKADRVAMTGPVYDPWGQNTKGWLVTKYDPFGRVAYTGFYQSSNFSSSERTALSQNNFTVEKKTSSNTIDGISVAYTNTSFPTSMRLLSVNYYDNYSYPNAPSTFPSIESQAANTSVKGHATGSWTRVLTNSTSTSGNLSYNLYDNRYRPIRSYETNHLGGFTQKDSKLNFTGLPSKVTTTTKYNSSATQYSYVDNFTYDRRDRMLTHTQVIGSREEKISTLSYDPLGVLTQKKVGGLTGNLQTVDFTYNIRGWMTHINKNTTDDDLFFYELNYNKDSFVPLFNGNISSNKYFTKQDYVLRGYNYNYDHLNRLVNALSIKKYGRSILEDNLYDESLSYDKNGNILTLYRNTELNYLPHNIDNLTYEYQGNQLLKVSDSSGSPSGFKDGTNTGNDYSYDTFGNIKQDLNKNLTNITYNHLNLPVEITFANGSKINYTYDAAGTRKSKRVQPTAGAVVTTDYMNEFQYENSQLQFISHPEGYVKHNGGGQFMYVYQYKDHLGNIRLSYADVNNDESIDSASEILEENNYYPFGLKHQGYNEIANNNRSEAAEKYKYGGKEWNDELGLDLYDFHARNYDPAIGRWLNVDNLSELYFSNSSYVYALNTPVQAIDPDGNVVIFINGNHFGDGAKGYENWRKGKSSYNWQGSSDYWNSNGKSFDRAVMTHLGDNIAIYRDGAIGGMFGFSSDNPIGVNTAVGRIRAGYYQGKRDAETIIKNLARDKTTGEIVETIKIITHSMGGAYGKGYVKALKEYIKTLSKGLQKQIKISLVADFDPFQAGSLSADSDIFTQQFSHIGKRGRNDSDGMGWLANERQNGLSNGNYYEDKNEAGHSIFTFFNNIENLQEGFYKWNGSGWECTNCK